MLRRIDCVLFVFLALAVSMPTAWAQAQTSPSKKPPNSNDPIGLAAMEYPWDNARRLENEFAFTSQGGEVNILLGTSSGSTRFINIGNFSAGVEDAHADNSTKPSGTGFVGGVGVSFPVFDYFDLSGTWAVADAIDLSPGIGNIFDKPPPPISRYTPENGRKAYAASFPALPTKAPPKQKRRPRITFGIDGNVYFFAGGDQTITGIPGGPFGTATGTDSFRISNNYMFTVGGWITAPITPTWRVSLTGGLAELNQTVKYNCVTFCTVAPATPAFTASQDKWVTGGYIGGRLAMPVALPSFPGASIGIDYKHVFFGNYNVALGSIPTRQVNARLSPDMDLVTVRLAAPIR